jgi:tRNA(Ile)-lysidine synthase
MPSCFRPCYDAAVPSSIDSPGDSLGDSSVDSLGDSPAHSPATSRPRGAGTEVARALAAALASAPPGLLGVACSGGADSIALVDAAAEVLGAASVVLLHIDHGLRAGSAEVAAEVCSWAERRGVKAVARRVHVPAGASLEQSARQARYQALDQLADEVGVVAVATAHTARDQAETVLMRIVRGTGIAGLAAIPARRGRYLRPLLDVERAAIERYVQERALPVWEDPMNADPRFLRSRVRHHLMAELRAENPSVEAALRQLAAHAQEWADAIDLTAEPLSRQLRASALVVAPAAVRKRAFALALGRLGLGFDAEHLEQLDQLMSRAHGTQRVALPGATAVREYDDLRFERSGAPSFRAGQHVEAAATRSLPAAIPAALLDEPARFVVRRPSPGDRMRPSRLQGRSRKLSDLFIDAKVPQRQRALAQVVCQRSDGAIVWVEHLGFAYGVENEAERAPPSDLRPTEPPDPAEREPRAAAPEPPDLPDQPGRVP